MKKRTSLKILYGQTLGVAIWLILIIQQTCMKLPIYQVQEAVCLDQRTLLLKVDAELERQLQQNQFFYYRSNKIMYEWEKGNETQTLILHVPTDICQDQTITISNLMKKQKLYSILLENWRK